MAESTRTLRFSLPLPPSVNALWNTTKTGKVFRSKKYMAWLQEAGQELRAACGAKLNDKTILLPGAVEIFLDLGFPKDHREHDIDNCVKATLDLLVRYHVLATDSYTAVQKQTIQYHPELEAACYVTVRPFTPAIERYRERERVR